MSSEEEEHINEILSPIDSDLLNGLTEGEKEMLAHIIAYNLTKKEQQTKQITAEQKSELSEIAKAKTKEQELARIERKKKESRNLFKQFCGG